MEEIKKPEELTEAQSETVSGGDTFLPTTPAPTVTITPPPPTSECN